MDKKQASFLNMGAALKATSNAHTNAWNNFDDYALPYEIFKTLLQDAFSAAAVQSTSTKGATTAKKAIRRQLEPIALKLADCLVLWGMTGGESTQMVADAKMTKSKLRGMSEDKLITFVTKLISITPGAQEQPPTPPAGLIALGVTAQLIQSVESKLAAFVTAKGTPRHVRAESVRGTRTLKKIIKQLRDVLDKEMDPAMAVLQYTQPVFYAEYMVARKMVEPAKRCRALAVQVMDATERTPLAGAKAMITPGNIVKMSAEKGAFYLETLTHGNYRIDIDRPGYRPQTVEVAIVEGQRTAIDVLMTKLA